MVYKVVVVLVVLLMMMVVMMMMIIVMISIFPMKVSPAACQQPHR